MPQAKRDFSAGLLKDAVLVRVPMTRTEWTVRLSGAKGDTGVLLDAQTLEPQVFSRLDAAVHALEQIGFAFDQLRLR